MKTVSDYLDELRATKRQIHRLAILQRASNLLPPGALTELYLQLRGVGGQELCKLAPNYAYMTAKPRRRAALEPQLVPQGEVDLTELYKITGEKLENKTLFILFSGKDGEFFLPLAVIISLLPAGASDVLVVRSGLERYYRDGVDGLGVSPFEVSCALIKRYNIDDYGKLVVMGISAGGTFALKIAALMEADIAISFGGVYPTDAFRLGLSTQLVLTAFDPVCDCTPSMKGRMINVLSSKNEYDFLASLQIKKRRPKLMQFHLVNSFRHNVLLRMMKTRTAALFFRLALSENNFPIWAISNATYGYGTFVRSVRRAFGVQKIQNWYLKQRG